METAPPPHPLMTLGTVLSLTLDDDQVRERRTEKVPNSKRACEGAHTASA